MGGEPQQERRFLDRLARLHRDAPVESRRLQQRAQIARQKIPPQRRHGVVDPRVLDRIEPPEMLVGVDARNGVHTGRHSTAGTGVPPRALDS